MRIKLEKININGGTQSRAFVNEDVVKEYEEILLEDDSLPPITVFYDGVNHFLADGFHRFFANKKAGFVDIECDVKQGTLRDAILFSVGANAVHGLRRSNEDKRKAVTTLLQDIEWGDWSDNEIARQCVVSAMTVGRIRKSLGLEKTERKYEKNGKATTMKTENIKPSDPVTLKPLEVMEQEDKLKELAVAHEELAEENSRLLDRIAVGLMDGTEEEKQAAADTIESLRAQLTTAEAELRAVKISRDQFQSQNADLIKQVAYWRKRAEKAEKIAA